MVVERDTNAPLREDSPLVTESSKRSPEVP